MKLNFLNPDPVTINLSIDITESPPRLSKISITDSSSEEGGLTDETRHVRFCDVPRTIPQSNADYDKTERWYSPLELREMVHQLEVEQQKLSPSVARSYSQVLSSIFQLLKSNTDDSACVFPRANYDRLLRLMSSERDRHVLTGLERKVARNVESELDRHADSTRQAVTIIQRVTGGHAGRIRKASLQFSRPSCQLASIIGHAHHEALRNQERTHIFRVLP